MKSISAASLLLTAAYAGLAAAAAVRTASLTLTNNPFTLRPGGDRPANLTGLGSVSDANGSLGWNILGDNSTEPIQLIFTDKDLDGAVYKYGSANDTKQQLFLRPTHGTPEYFAKLGDPAADLPEEDLSGKFTISAILGEGTDVPEYFLGIGGNTEQWAACGSNGSWDLYYGAGPQFGFCTGGFTLQMIFTPSS